MGARQAQKAAFGEAMKLFEEKAYEYNRELRQESIDQFRANGGEIYTPNEAELEEWRELGRQVWTSDVVTENVPQEVIEQVLDAQK